MILIFGKTSGGCSDVLQTVEMAKSMSMKIRIAFLHQIHSCGHDRFCQIGHVFKCFRSDFALEVEKWGWLGSPPCFTYNGVFVKYSNERYLLYFQIALKTEPSYHDTKCCVGTLKSLQREESSSRFC